MPIGPNAGLIIDPQGQQVILTMTSVPSNVPVSMFDNPNGTGSGTTLSVISQRTKVYVKPGTYQVSATLGGIQIAGQVITLDDTEVGSVVCANITWGNSFNANGLKLVNVEQLGGNLVTSSFPTLINVSANLNTPTLNGSDFSGQVNALTSAQIAANAMLFEVQLGSAHANSIDVFISSADQGASTVNSWYTAAGSVAGGLGSFAVLNTLAIPNLTSFTISYLCIGA